MNPNKKTVIKLVCIFFIVFLFHMVVFSERVEASTTYECDSVPTCNTAIQSALPGDIVQMNQSITGAGATAINMSASNITFDCSGYWINGTSTSSSIYGINFGNPVSANYTTIQNCKFSHFRGGIYTYLNSKGNAFFNITSLFNSYYGISAGGTGISGGGITPSLISCTPATNPTLSGICGSFQCGEVNNGTCGTVSCGSGCGTEETCNVSSHTCVVSSTSCVPATDPTLSGLCTNNGYTCGSVNNGTCGTVSCGSTCSSGKYCDLVSGSSTFHTCVDVSSCSSAPADFCSSHGYTCGQFNNGTCGGTIDCGLQGATGTEGCNLPDFCNSTYQCQAPYVLNSGTIDSVYPSGAVRFFSSESLPKSQSEDNALTNKNYYARFPNSNEAGCSKVSYAQYMPAPKNESFVSLSLPAGDSVNIIQGNDYEIWNTQNGCLNAAELL